MAKKAIDTGAKYCPYCGESYYRKRYKNRYEQIDRFELRDHCGKEECFEEHRSVQQKKSWNKRKGITSEPERVKTPVDVWLSTGHSNRNSVRYKKK